MIGGSRLSDHKAGGAIMGKEPLISRFPYVRAIFALGNELCSPFPGSEDQTKTIKNFKNSGMFGLKRKQVPIRSF